MQRQSQAPQSGCWQDDRTSRRSTRETQKPRLCTTASDAPEQPRYHGAERARAVQAADWLKEEVRSPKAIDSRWPNLAMRAERLARAAGYPATRKAGPPSRNALRTQAQRSEEHTSELQSRENLVF